MWKSIIASLLIIIGSFHHVLANGEVAVPFELINGLIVVEAEINGVKENFIVDSGSNGILLNGKSEKSDVSYATLSGSMTGSEKKIDKLRVGDFEMKSLLGFSTDLSNLEVYLDRSIGGILSCSVFTPHSLVFDFNSSQLVISDQDVSPTETIGMSVLDFKIIEDLPVTQININGKLFSFILDSGATSHFVDQSFLVDSRLKNTPTGKSKNIITAAGVSQVSKEYLISNDDSDSWSEVTAFEKDFSAISEEFGIEISGLISLSKLSKDKVYLDVKKNKLYY